MINVVVDAPKFGLENALGNAIKEAKLDTDERECVKVTALGVLRIAYGMMRSLDDPRVHVELHGDVVSMEVKVALS